MAKATRALRERIVEQRDKLRKQHQRATFTRKNWWKILTAFIAVYIALPIAAPVMMKAGATGPAEALYTIYSPMCHQFAFRSTFLFGEQVEYPRTAAEVDDQGTYEAYVSQSDEFREIYVERKQDSTGDDYQFNQADLLVWDQDLQLSSREFRGDETIGYKIALCQRDTMIYLAMLVGAIIFAFTKSWIRPAPILLYLLLGIGPIGLDGFSQLFGYPPFDQLPIFEAWEVRETQPLFRYLTGALFGIMNVWLAFPWIHRSAVQSEHQTSEMLEATEKQLAKLDAKLEKKGITFDDES